MIDNFNYYTYAYLRENGTPYYVGKGKGKRAFYGKRGGYKVPKNKNRILILKKNLSEYEAHRHEVYMIDVFGRKDIETGILYNKTNGGEGKSGWIMPEEVKKKIGKSNKGKTSWLKGKVAHNFGIPASEETRKKCSIANLGRKMSLEARKKMSLAKKGKLLSENCYNSIRTPVVGTNTLGEQLYFLSATEASKKTNINRSHISACCRGERKTAGKLKWCFYDINIHKFMENIK